jgi:alpha,alpha-trehalase
VCLNSLLYRYERDMEHFAHLLGMPADALKWDRRAKKRDAAMQQYLWSAKDGVYQDYDYFHARKSSYAYISSLYPLWAGVALREQAQKMVAQLNLFERPGGLSMSNFNSGMQWDEPYGWAPTNWIAVAGLNAAGFRDDAKRLARKFDAAVDAGFAVDGTIVEKYNMVAKSSDVKVSTGYKVNQIGFGWTNSAYLKMKEIIAEK